LLEKHAPTRSGRRYRLAAGLAIAAAAAVGCGDAPDATRSVGPLGEGVARVEVVWRDTGGVRRNRAFGTAFRVGSQGDLLTAHHVAANARTQRAKLGQETRARIQVTFAATGPEPGIDAGGPLSIEVAIAAEDPDADLALLRSVEPPPAGGEASAPRGPAGGIARGDAARLASAQPPAESLIAVVGYPIGEPDLVVRTGRLLDRAVLDGAPAASGPLRSWLDERLHDGAVLLADVEIRLGNSGAPIYLEESGEIIGLCSAVLFRNHIAKDELIPLPNPPGAPITLIITAQRIQSFLAAHRVPGR
jgi:S1-C subfamily serine protease